MRPVIRQDVASYLGQLADVPGDAILDEMHQLAEDRGFPIVGPEVGRLLAQLTQLVGAKRVFELGSGFGYSTLWFARALGPDGVVFHTDSDGANSELARDFLDRAGVVDRVELLLGDALELLRDTPGELDIVFCDIDKHQYGEAYDLVSERVRVGGLVIVDNLVWYGRVAAGEADADTAGVRAYIERMWADRRFLSSLMPVRDGVGLSLRVRQ